MKVGDQLLVKLSHNKPKYSFGQALSDKMTYTMIVGKETFIIENKQVLQVSDKVEYFDLKKTPHALVSLSTAKELQESNILKPIKKKTKKD